MTKTKAKINRTTRIRVVIRGSVCTIYCASHITNHVKNKVMRLAQNVLVPLKDQNDELLHTLRQLAKKEPNLFNSSGLDLLV